MQNQSKRCRHPPLLNYHLHLHSLHYLQPPSRSRLHSLSTRLSPLHICIYFDTISKIWLISPSGEEASDIDKSSSVFYPFFIQKEFQVERPVTLKKEGIQTRNRKLSSKSKKSKRRGGVGSATGGMVNFFRTGLETTYAPFSGSMGGFPTLSRCHDV